MKGRGRDPDVQVGVVSWGVGEDACRSKMAQNPFFYFRVTDIDACYP